jgi:hypothetical protein
MLDGWSAFHHGYIGVIATYVHNGKRYFLCIGVIRFDESHTSTGLAAWLKDLLESWRVFHVTDVVTTDTAANVKAMIKYLHKDGCSETTTADKCQCFSWGACVAHVLNLVVQSDFFAGVLIMEVIEQCKDIATHYNQSNIFAAAVRQAQMDLQGKTEAECLVIFKSVKTRWNSTHLMLAR